MTLVDLLLADVNRAGMAVDEHPDLVGAATWDPQTQKYVIGRLTKLNSTAPSPSAADWSANQQKEGIPQ